MSTQLPGFCEGAQLLKVEPFRTTIDSITQVVYSQIRTSRGVHQLQMNLLIPRNSRPKPAILFFPGGGFTHSVNDRYIQMRMALAEAGFVVASAEYRVVPDKYPALVIDGKTAVRFLRESASDFEVDPNRIAVLGDSAGGYLAQMVAFANGSQFEQGQYLTQSSAVQAGATIYGISNLLNIGGGFGAAIDDVHRSPAATEALLLHGPAFFNFPGASIFNTPRAALDASPMGNLEGTKPPMLILHGSDDKLVSPYQSLQLYQALRERNQAADYYLLEGAGHGDEVWYQSEIIQLVCDWFKTHL